MSRTFAGWTGSDVSNLFLFHLTLFGLLLTSAFTFINTFFSGGGSRIQYTSIMATSDNPALVPGQIPPDLTQKVINTAGTNGDDGSKYSSTSETGKDLLQGCSNFP
jgi:hypothetical protein